jgi:hypothetical protein
MQALQNFYDRIENDPAFAKKVYVRTNLVLRTWVAIMIIIPIPFAYWFFWADLATTLVLIYLVGLGFLANEIKEVLFSPLSVEEEEAGETRGD